MPTIRSQVCKVNLIILFAALVQPTALAAQTSEDWTYQVGGRTTFMTTTMHLSHLGAAFRDLPPGGKRFAHASSLFLLWPRGRHLRLGVETLVGNSYGDSDTGILYQAVGVTAEYLTGRTWFVAVGAQGGAMIASAAQPTAGAGDGSEVRSGSYYKGFRLFFAPSFAFGRVFGRRELRVLPKQVLHISESEALDAFDSMYLGVSLGLKRR